MLIAEYDYDTDIAVQRSEERRIAFAEGIEQGIQHGFSKGAYQKALETAKLMIAHHYPVSEISLMTGLPQEEIEKL